MITAFFTQLHTFELEWIYAIQSLRSSLLDQFFIFMNFFDTSNFILILVATVWVGYYWKPGMRLFSILTLSGITNFLLKQLFAEPRPLHIDPTVGLINLTTYGFPSGGAQTAFLLSGIIIASFRSCWKWVVASCFFILLSFSRIYLGVHFPSDILAGWIVGALLLALYLKIFPVIEQFLASRSTAFITILSLAVSSIPVLLYPSTATIRFCVAFAGGALGTLLLLHLNAVPPKPKHVPEFCVRVAVGIIGAFTISWGMATLPLTETLLKAALESSAIGLWLGFAANYICYKLYYK